MRVLVHARGVPLPVCVKPVNPIYLVAPRVSPRKRLHSCFDRPTYFLLFFFHLFSGTLFRAFVPHRETQTRTLAAVIGIVERVPRRCRFCSSGLPFDTSPSTTSRRSPSTERLYFRCLINFFARKFASGDSGL